MKKRTKKAKQKQFVLLKRGRKRGANTTTGGI